MEWERFLTDHHIDYVTRGPNTKRGEVSVRCPWCGADDPSHHLGISLTREVWGCHRDASHRGKSTPTLIQALLGCSNTQAKLITSQYNHSDPDDLEAATQALTNEAAEPEGLTPGPVQWPKEFRDAILGDRFSKYLIHRGINHQVMHQFGLKVADTGRYKDRVIFPLYNGDLELIAWTGRAITNPISAPRYLASSGAAKTTVYNYDKAAEGGDILFIVEGPFDALKVDCCDVRHKQHAVALMGTSMTLSQLGLLRRLMKRYAGTCIMLDGDAEAQAAVLVDWLPTSLKFTLESGEDPASISKRDLSQLTSAIHRCLNVNASARKPRLHP